jgi:hypothetical protein
MDIVGRKLCALSVGGARVDASRRINAHTWGFQLEPFGIPG